MDPVLALIAVMLVFAVLGAWLGGTKGRSNEGLALGLVLGPIGIVIALLLPPKDVPGVRKCKFCREPVADDASVCPHCQREIGAAFNSTCKACGRGFNAPPARLGHVVRCPHCQKMTQTSQPEATA